jgi:hypothetical protein
VTIDSDTNRAYVHTGGDALSDGYWKRPFDVVRSSTAAATFTKRWRRSADDSER